MNTGRYLLARVAHIPFCHVVRGRQSSPSLFATCCGPAQFVLWLRRFGHGGCATGGVVLARRCVVFLAGPSQRPGLGFSHSWAAVLCFSLDHDRGPEFSAASPPDSGALASPLSARAACPFCRSRSPSRCIRPERRKSPKTVKAAQGDLYPVL